MATRKHANNFSTTLNGSITNVATSITLTSATGLPAIGAGEVYRLTIVNGSTREIVEVTDDASTPTLTVTRGMEGTTGTAFASGSVVSLRTTADSHDRKADGAASSTDNAIARYDGTTGKILQNSGVTLSDDNNVLANNYSYTYTTTATAAGTTTLTVASGRLQYFTGSTTQTVVLPVVSTLTTGHTFDIINLSSGNVTIQSSGGNSVQVLTGGSACKVVCILTSGTTAASWSVIPGNISGVSSLTGTTNQISVSAATGAVTISIPSNPILPGTQGVVIPQGSTGSRPGAGTTGRMRFNTSTGFYELDEASTWRLISSSPETTTANAIPVYAATNSPRLVDSGVTISNGNINSTNPISGYTTTATAAGTTTLTVSSTRQQFFTGSTTQNCRLPVTSTLTTGHRFEIINNSSGVVTVQSSGANTIVALAAGTMCFATCISTSGTGASSWDYVYLPNATGIIGTGSLVRGTSPTLFTPTFTFATPGDQSIAYAFQSGAYTRIGHVVNFSISIRWTATYTTASGRAEFLGLPSTPDTSFTYVWNVFDPTDALTFPTGTTFITARQASSQAGAVIAGMGSGVTPVDFSTTNFASGVQYTININGSYFVA